jgi:ABC-2 type transport system permease protein
MFMNMLRFEWRYFTRQPSFVVTMLVFFLLPYLSVVIDNVQIGSGGNVNFNSPYSIALTMLILGFFGMFLVVNFVANTANRNDEVQMSEILYTKPIHPVSYQLGRFFGAYLVVITVSAMVPLGLFFGSLMPWVDSERLGDNNLLAYLVPFFVFSIPTLFVLSTMFYAAALRLEV